MLRIFFFIVFSVSLPCLGADLVRQPVGLKPGDRYRLFFTTSETRDGTSTDADEYNSFVQTVADAAPVVGSWNLTWTAVARTPDTRAQINSNTDPLTPDLNRIPEEDRIPIYRVDGQQIWYDYQHMWEFLNENVPSAPTVTEIGTEYIGSVWTGTINATDPGSFPLGTQTPYLGFSDSKSAVWCCSGGSNRFDEYPLYAISEVITAVPEPNSLLLLFLASTLMILLRRRENCSRIPPEI